MKVTLAAMVRNEFPYIVEWIAHHQAIGVDNFVIASIESNDGTNELVKALEKAGVVTSFYMPWHGWIKPQEPLKKMVSLSENSDWFGFLDLDEFFVPMGNNSLKGMLKSMPQEIGGVAICNALYGSSYQRFSGVAIPSPVTARFTWRSKQFIRENGHVKSFCRIKSIDREMTNSCHHTMQLLAGYKYANPKGELLDIDGRNPIQTIDKEKINWDVARINHYILKSDQEYFNIKLQRGLPKRLQRNKSTFVSRDINEVFDPMALHLQMQRDIKMGEIIAKLKNVGYEYPTSLVNEYPDDSDIGFQYRIENVYQEKHQIIISGWLVDGNGRDNIENLGIFVQCPNKDKFTPTEIQLVKREDIRTQIPYAPLWCGFTIKIKIPSIESNQTWELFALEKYVQQIEIKSTKKSVLSNVIKLLQPSTT